MRILNLFSLGLLAATGLFPVGRRRGEGWPGGRTAVSPSISSRFSSDWGESGVRKDDLRTEAYGTTDELVAALGMARAYLGDASAGDAGRS